MITIIGTIREANVQYFHKKPTTSQIVTGLYIVIGGHDPSGLTNVRVVAKAEGKR